MTVQSGPRQVQVTDATGRSVFRVVQIPATGGIVEVGNVEMSDGGTALIVTGCLGILSAEVLFLVGVILRSPSDKDKRENSAETLANWDRTGKNLEIGAAISGGVGLAAIGTAFLLPRVMGTNVHEVPKVAIGPTPNGWQFAFQTTF